MPDVNVMEHIDETGKFTETFKEQISSIAGEEFKDSKIFDSVPDIATLVKNYAYTKRDFGKKIDGLIQKPAENATDEQKAEYRKMLLKELGAPEKAEDYVIKRPENLPEGVSYDEEVEKHFREVFLKLGVPNDIASALTDEFNQLQMSRFQAALEKQKTEFIESSKALDKDPAWLGENRIKNNRIAFKAVLKFAGEDLAKLFKDAKLNEDVANHQKWHDLGFNPAQRRIWYNIGLATKVDEAITDEGTPKNTFGGPQKLTQKLYDHPTSKRELFNKT